ncbi:unnamed protein product [Thelazia callipaeda]|uniref:NR LBD domain-containing protein n=1 Tax=Thelazia callipaeda TaxID=103827 RepID=A0A0N5CVJ4_THECL|nr:unnamed protein product [Thelazia callipaeda]
MLATAIVVPVNCPIKMVNNNKLITLIITKSTTLEDSCSEALLLQIDWRSECLQERLKLSRCIVERMAISEMLIMKLIEAYEVAAQSLAPFSVTKMKQRIVGLCSIISDYLRNFSG